MNITSTYPDVHIVTFSPTDLCDKGVVNKICVTCNNGVIVHLTKEALFTLRDEINKLYPPVEPDEPELGLPEEPDEPGYYITQQNLLVINDTDGDWYIREGLWKDRSKYTKNWILVYETLGDEAFPLTKLNTGEER